MKIDELTSYFSANFSRPIKHRSIGLEYEYPVVYANGNGVTFEVITSLFKELKNLGWEIIFDEITQQAVAAKKKTDEATQVNDYNFDLITTEFGYSVIEFVLSPSTSLQAAEAKLVKLVKLVTSLLEKHQAFLLGYGIHPLNPPAAQYVCPRGRYQILESGWMQNPRNILDVYCLTLSASCQTHVEVSLAEAIPITNALNATAGLRIALLANSPIWQGAPTDYNASRELFWDWCYQARVNQVGIPPYFEDIHHYIDYLLKFSCLLVKRDNIPYKLDPGMTISQYFDCQELPAESVTGDIKKIQPLLKDIHVKCGMAWFDARLQSAYGTIEDRCSCQQPPHEHLVSSALTLGLVENLSGVATIADTLTLNKWRDIRIEACKNGIEMTYQNIDMLPLLQQLLDVAHTGLKSRGLGEERYLSPLYNRLESRSCPAKQIREMFIDGGVESIVSFSNMNRFVADNAP